MKDPQKQRIKDLEKQLADAKLKIIAYQALVSIAAQEDGISDIAFAKPCQTIASLLSYPKKS